MFSKMPFHEYSVSWLDLASDEPGKLRSIRLSARSVPHALTRFYAAMAASPRGKSRNGLHVLEVSNLDLP